MCIFIFYNYKSKFTLRHYFIFNFDNRSGFNKFFFNLVTLPKLLNSYDVVILDRWSASVLVYGLSTGVNNKVVNRMFKALKHADITVILNGESFNKKNKDSYEKDDNLQMRVKKYYTKYQNDYINKKKILVLSPNQELNVIHNMIVNYINKKTTR